MSGRSAFDRPTTRERMDGHWPRTMRERIDNSIAGRFYAQMVARGQIAPRTVTPQSMVIDVDGDNVPDAAVAFAPIPQQAFNIGTTEPVRNLRVRRQDGAHLSLDPDDTHLTFDPIASFQIPNEADYKARCDKPDTCYTNCKAADKVNREKCNLLRKRVACALKDAGCPSTVTPMMKKKKVKKTTDKETVKAANLKKAADLSMLQSRKLSKDAEQKLRTMAAILNNSKKKATAAATKAVTVATKAASCGPRVSRSGAAAIARAAAPKVVCNGGVCKLVR